MKDLLRENFKRERILGLYSGNPPRRVEVQSPREIHLDRVSIQLAHLRPLGRHNHLGRVHHCLVLLLKEDLCQKRVPAIIYFIQELLVCHKEYVFIVDKQGILRRIVQC